MCVYCEENVWCSVKTGNVIRWEDVALKSTRNLREFTIWIEYKIVCPYRMYQIYYKVFQSRIG